MGAAAGPAWAMSRGFDDPDAAVGAGLEALRAGDWPGYLTLVFGAGALPSEALRHARAELARHGGDGFDAARILAERRVRPDLRAVFIELDGQGPFYVYLMLHRSDGAWRITWSRAAADRAAFESLL